MNRNHLLEMGRLSAVTVLAFASFASQAHVTLETREAPAGSFYKAVVKVPHGCDGQPTTRLRVQIPTGVTGVKTMLKHGWKVQVVKEKLAAAQKDSHGNAITEAAKEVIWSGGRLADDNYDEFVMQVRLPDTANTDLYFPVVQECTKGVHRWIEIPEAGKSGALKEPAPRVRLLSKPAAH